MLRAVIAAAVVLFGSAGLDGAWAIYRGFGSNAEQCGCTCETASGTSSGRYNSNGQSCNAFNNATCNRENANGQIETGKLTGCATIINLKDYMLRHPDTPLHSPSLGTPTPTPRAQ